MKIVTLTDPMEAEIERLKASDDVKLARKEQRLKYKRRQALYLLRNLEKRGKELREAGVTMENMEEMIQAIESEAAEED